jgi:2,3,4,5-tetrahydropyridine-2-carboxylate N-succinyltransferase
MTLNQQYQALADLIDSAWEQRAGLSPSKVSSELRDAVETCLDGLETGELRVAEPGGDAGRWIVNQWLKKAVLLSFRIHGNEVIDASYTKFFDKLPLRWGSEFGESIDQTGARVVPPATVRRGAHIGHDAVLMPSYVNIGAYVGAGTMVDTWATVGSCAQIGSHVHLSGGVGIGGVLEPLQASPTIIEDNCFIGARSSVRARRYTIAKPVK